MIIKLIDAALYYGTYFGVFTLILALWKALTNFSNTFIFFIGVIIAFVCAYFSKYALKIPRVYIGIIIIILWVLSFYLFAL